MATETKQIMEMLTILKSELDYIKENMPNKDMFLTTEEKKLLDASYENEDKGILVSTKDFERQSIVKVLKTKDLVRVFEKRNQQKHL